MNRESFHDRFSTGTKKREEDSGQQSLEDLLSTSTKGREGLFEKGGGLWEILIMLVVAFDLVFGLVRPFVAEPMRVPSESMSPTLQTGDRVLTNKLVYDFADPERGDLVVFQSVDEQRDEKLVKRVIGLPGDEISVQNGTLLVDGEPPYEPYIAAEEDPPPRNSPGVTSFGPIVVPRNHVFVMGDNRRNSYDSRFFGPVPEEKLVGEPSLRFWPPDHLGSP